MNNENIQYDNQGRMKYNPAFHFNQGEPWTNIDQKYLIDNYAKLGPLTLSYDLGRTFTTVANRAYELRKSGLMPLRS